MLRNHLTVAFRNLRRRKGYTALNVVGLALGVACVVLIGLYLHDGLAYDRFHPNADRIVRMTADFEVEGEVRKNVSTQGLLAPALEADFPEVEYAVRLTGTDAVFEVGDVRFQEDDVVYADAATFEVLNGFELLRGDPATALAGPDRLVLSETLARKYFGDDDPLGQTVTDRGTPLTVTGVMADVPPQSSLTFDAVISLDGVEDPGWWYSNWFSVNFVTFALLEEEASLDAFRAKLPAFAEARAGAEMAEMDQGLAFHADRLPDVHLRADRGTGGSLANLYALGAVGLFVLLIACANFTNLATARSVERAKEVGVRKTLGASRGGLAVQFLVEAVVLSAVALVVALALVQAALPGFELLTGKALGLSDLGAGLLGIAGLALVTGVLAGAYPALVLSGFQPVEVLKGRFATGRRGTRLREGLVIVQFTVTVMLLAGTAIVFSQLRYMQGRDLGFDPGSGGEQLLTLDFGGDEAVQARLATVKGRLEAHPAVVGVASSGTVPAGMTWVAGGGAEGPDGRVRDFSVEAYLVDTAFVGVYGLRLVAGEPPGAATTSDSLAAFVFNEAAVRALGYASPEDALGARAVFWGRSGEVVGVVRDFHTRGLQRAVEPMALLATQDYQEVLTLRVRTDGLAETLGDLEAAWAEVAPQRPFAYAFLDEAFGQQYEGERRFGRVFGAFAGLAMFVACLGLFGLAAFTAEQRTKELGVRKVLGAGVGSLVVLLTRSTVRPVAVAFVLAAPAAYLLMSRWLEAFAYRTEIGPGVFVFAGGVAFAVALGTVALQSFRAARADPIRALQAE